MLLSPAVADIVERLGVAGEIVAVSSSIVEFPQATRVGTHINPCMECIAAVKPTLIIGTSRFSQQAADKLHAKLYKYEPSSIDNILSSIVDVGKLLGRAKKAGELVSELNKVLSDVAPLAKRATVLYEVRSNPLSLAGRETIMSDALSRAGLVNLFGNARTSAVSSEYVLATNPDYYIYQVGTMNAKPTLPTERKGWNRLKSQVWRVDETIFARANTNVIYEIARINKMLRDAQ
ncbi:hypothetical protein RsTz2092_09300 [Deferribacterales bacterium RsTz2092]